MGALRLSHGPADRPAPWLAADEVLARSIEAASRHEHPFAQLHLRNPLPPRVLAGLAALPFEPPPAFFTLGRPPAGASRTHRLGRLETERHPACAEAVRAFAAAPVVAALEERLEISLRGCAARLWLAHQADGYASAPATAAASGRVRLLLALGPSCEADLGPDLYLDRETWAAQLPWGPGLAFAFATGPASWHGFEPRLIRRLRSLLIVDYTA